MKTIDSSKVEKLGFIKTKLHGSESELFLKDDICYKKFKVTDEEYLKDKERKIEFLSTINDLNEAVLPLSKGYNNERNILDGYFMNYYENGINMYELSKFITVKDLRKYFMAVNLLSLALKRVHEREEGIIIGDASFNNVIVLENSLGIIEKTLFIDFDSVELSSIPCEYKSTSELLSNLFSDLGSKEYIHSKNTDRLSYLLYFLNSFFALNILELPIYEYDSKCELSNTLKNLRTIVLKIKNSTNIKDLPTIPYIHEVLDLADVYELSKKL